MSPVGPVSRREFLKRAAAGACLSFIPPLFPRETAAAGTGNPVYWVTDIPDQPFLKPAHPNFHAGVESLLFWMGKNGQKFYRSSRETILAGPAGMIEPQDVVLIKVNATWKYRGVTNTDLLRGLIQRVLDHPDGFRGEIVIFDNAQGNGNLECNMSLSYPDATVHANANDERQSFSYLVDSLFRDPRVTARLLDSFRTTMISAEDHRTDGFRIFENVSYPCFTTARGNRVELREGIWQGSGYAQNLKLINVPVLKHHDVGGAEFTGALKNFYGVLSMADGQHGFRHYTGLGETCGKVVAAVRTPVLNVVDAIWVAHGAIEGYPSGMTFRANQLLASQDPVALDYLAAKYVLYPIDQNSRHHPDSPGIAGWLAAAETTINTRGPLADSARGIFVQRVTRNENEMAILRGRCRTPYRFNLRAG